MPPAKWKQAVNQSIVFGERLTNVPPELFKLTSAHKTPQTYGRNGSGHNALLDNSALPVTV